MMPNNSEVIQHATSLLCEFKGSMEISELYRRLLQRWELSDERLDYILNKCPRFAVLRNRDLRRPGEGECRVVAKTSLRLCKTYCQQQCSGCQDLHLCKYFIYGNCRFGKGRKECKFSHNIHSDHNHNLLRECTLHQLNEEELFLLLLQNDPALLPEVCSYYNKGSGHYGACTFQENCTKVHLCQHFVQDDCIFGVKCKRSHCIDEFGSRMLEERGISIDIIHDLPYIYQNVYRLTCCNSDEDKEMIPEPVEPVSSVEVHLEENRDICLHFLRGNCRFQEQCKLVHFNRPYKWEVFEGNGWRDLRGMEAIERAYCDPKNTHSPGSKPVNFLNMTRNEYPVRRLSTASSITKPPHYVLTTHWIWFYKGDHDNWIEYGTPDDKQRVTSVTSCDLEEAFLADSTAQVPVKKGNRVYYISFKDMYQRNPKHNTKRKVRRRPMFVSGNQEEGKIAL